MHNQKNQVTKRFYIVYQNVLHRIFDWKIKEKYNNKKVNNKKGKKNNIDSFFYPSKNCRQSDSPLGILVSISIHV